MVTVMGRVTEGFREGVYRKEVKVPGGIGA